MRRKTVVTLLAGVLVVGLTGIVMAGFDPTPFTPLINELNSVVNVLSAEDSRLKAVLAIPPNDQQPEGLVGKLNAMAYLLSVQNERVKAVLGIPPNDQRVVDALEAVGGNAEAIVNTVDEYL